MCSVCFVRPCPYDQLVAAREAMLSPMYGAWSYWFFSQEARAVYDVAEKRLAAMGALKDYGRTFELAMALACGDER